MKLIALTALVVVVVGASAAACGSSDKHVATRDRGSGGAGGERSGEPGGKQGSGDTTGGGGKSGTTGGESAGGAASDDASGGWPSLAEGGASAGGAGAEGGAGGAAAVGGGGADGEPLPLAQSLSDGTVALLHTIPSCAPSFGIDGNGNIFMAHTILGDGVHVVRLVNDKWTELGTLASEAGVGLNINVCPPLAVTSGGEVFVAYVSDTASQHQMRVRLWTGSAWENAFALTTAIGELAPVVALDMTVDPLDRVVLATAELITTNHRFKVRRRDTDTFAAYGNTVGSGNPAAVFVTTRPDSSVVLFGAQGVAFSKMLVTFTSSGGDFTELTQVASVPDSSWALHPTGIDADANSIWLSYWQSTSSGGPVVARLARSKVDGWDQLGDAENDTRYPSVGLTGGGALVQGYSLAPTCSLRSHDGSAYGAAQPLPFNADVVRIQVHSGQVYASYVQSSTAGLLLLNVPQ
jgi:hypothetical protein